MPLQVVNDGEQGRRTATGGVEAHGYVSIEAEHHDRLIPRSGATWQTVPGLGRCGAAVIGTPFTAARIDGDSRTLAPELQYNIRFTTAGTFPVTVDRPGDHILKLWMVDPANAIDQIVIDTGRLPATYLAPPESFHPSSTPTLGGEATGLGADRSPAEAARAAGSGTACWSGNCTGCRSTPPHERTRGRAGVGRRR